MSEDAVVLPVSLGEALDKLTILEIKLNKINDERKEDVNVEYNTLLSKLQEHVEKYSYYYRILKDINERIWDIQDRFHGKHTTKEEGATLCRDILLENDRRFRVKAKINTASKSILREQKGYAKKKAFVYSHLGLGDMFWVNGAVRYLSTAYDEVVVVCKLRNSVNAQAMYADDPTIKFCLINEDIDLDPWETTRNYFIEQGFVLYSCGAFSPKPEKMIYDLPNCFYDDMDIPREIRTTYFHVPRIPEAKELYNKFRDIKYIVVHEESSVQKLPIAEQLISSGETRLILDVNKNQYDKTHPFWSLAENVAGKRVLHYVDLIEGAEDVHMIESSIYCLTSHLNLSNVKRKVCYEPWGGNAERLGIFETGFCSTKYYSKYE